MLAWSPRDFWKATPDELFRAIEGWQEANGVSDPEPEVYMTRDELDDLMARFPDEKAPDHG